MAKQWTLSGVYKAVLGIGIEILATLILMGATFAIGILIIFLTYGVRMRP